MSKQSFWKQFLSGVFVAIVMTGLDQDMMQKNLTCKNLREAQKDMCTYGVCFIPVNFLFLVLGVLLNTFGPGQGHRFAGQDRPAFPMPYRKGWFGTVVTLLFVLALPPRLSSVGLGLTALTTSFASTSRY